MAWRSITGLSAISFLCLSLDATPAQESVDYLAEIKPILTHRCGSCHGHLKQQSGLRLDTRALALLGGASGAAIEPGRAADSLLIQRVSSEDPGYRMPLKESPLSAQEIDLLKRWVDQGAPAPADEQAVADPLRHWSYQSPKRPPAPEAPDRDWVRNPIDAWVSLGRQRLGLEPSLPATKGILLRRLYLDLIGVPPDRDEVQIFLTDDSPEAYSRVVDRLLASPLYGERWGRHWMDVWRYSDWYGRRGQNEIRYSQYHI